MFDRGPKGTSALIWGSIIFVVFVAGVVLWAL
jgi:hypothetical protein